MMRSWDKEKGKDRVQRHLPVLRSGLLSFIMGILTIKWGPLSSSSFFAHPIAQTAYIIGDDVILAVGFFRTC